MQGESEREIDTVFCWFCCVLEDMWPVELPKFPISYLIHC